jgi:hypothetical protein
MACQNCADNFKVILTRFSLFGIYLRGYSAHFCGLKKHLKALGPYMFIGETILSLHVKIFLKIAKLA